MAARCTNAESAINTISPMAEKMITLSCMERPEWEVTLTLITSKVLRFYAVRRFCILFLSEELRSLRLVLFDIHACLQWHIHSTQNMCAILLQQNLAWPGKGASG